jgi:hypothetical protein
LNASRRIIGNAYRKSADRLGIVDGFHDSSAATIAVSAPTQIRILADHKSPDAAHRQPLRAAPEANGLPWWPLYVASASRAVALAADSPAVTAAS